MPTAHRPVAGLAAEVCDHCDAPSHVNLASDSISNRFTGKQKGAAVSGCGAERDPLNPGPAGQTTKHTKYERLTRAEDENRHFQGNGGNSVPYRPLLRSRMWEPHRSTGVRDKFITLPFFLGEGMGG